MLVAAGNLDGLLGFAFNVPQLVDVSVESFASAPDGTVLDLLTELLAAAPLPAGFDGPFGYTVVGVDDGAGQITVNVDSYASGSPVFVQATTYNVLGYSAGALLVSSMTLSALVAALLAGQSVAGQVCAISAAIPTQGASQGFRPAGSYVGSLACFALGTGIRTDSGDVAVEDLRVGDRIPGQISGTMRQVCWIGRRMVRVRGHPRPWDVAPVRVRADALAPGRPHRDVLLSPDHAVLVGGALVPARYLLNGATIAQELCAAITYLHIELDTHDVLLADGLPCESYLDTGNRSALGGALPTAGPRSWRSFARMIPTHRPQQHGEPR